MQPFIWTNQSGGNLEITERKKAGLCQTYMRTDAGHCILLIKPSKGDRSGGGLRLAAWGKKWLCRGWKPRRAMPRKSEVTYFSFPKWRRDVFERRGCNITPLNKKVDRRSVGRHEGKEIGDFIWKKYFFWKLFKSDVFLISLKVFGRVYQGCSCLIAFSGYW